MSRKLFAMFTLATVVALGLSACGSNSYGTKDNGTGSTSGGPAGKDSSMIKIANTSLGAVLVDGSGRTLYLYTPDGNNATASKCTGACAQLWPAVMGKPKAGGGVDANLIGATAGTNQASYAGHLLYYYAKDSVSGDVTGQGVDSIWYVIDSKGKAVTKASSDSGSGGY